MKMEMEMETLAVTGRECQRMEVISINNFKLKLPADYLMIRSVSRPT